MYYSVKTLLADGKSISEIARTFNIDRKTVRKIKKSIEDGEITPPSIERKSILDNYKNDINDYLENEISSVLIHQKLTEKYNLTISYSAVKRYVRGIKGPDAPFMPLISASGEEAQVDFGYGGYFLKNGKKVKVWIFCMVLSFSRYGYFELVLDQSVPTFINCHIHAFEFFNGTSKTVKIDNLKSAVLKASFYEPIIQKEYAGMLMHYNSMPVTCRVKQPTDKGKVESGVKYVKNNFIKGLETKDYYEVTKELKIWTDKINQRIHGTTRKVPFEQFKKENLSLLPVSRFEIYTVERRQINNYGHICYRYNFYSLPYKYKGEFVTIKSNGYILKIYDEKLNQIAVHSISQDKGDFITLEDHTPVFRKNTDKYYESLQSIGQDALIFFDNIKKLRPHYWHRIIAGIISFRKYYSNEEINASLKRANLYSTFNYLSVKKILEDKLYDKKDFTAEATGSGYFTDLAIYDRLTGGANERA